MIIKHLELFSGIGGFRKAIDLFCEDHNLKSKCVGFSELDQFASRAYKANFDTSGETEIGDIGAFLKDAKNLSKIKSFNFLTAGFPCQPFSMMGLKNGFDDKRGSIFFSILHIIEQKKPKYFLLENVRNITSINKGETLKAILESLRNLNYEVSYDVFNTKDFGLPQNRRRIFFFGRKESEKKKIELDNRLISEYFSRNSHKYSLEKYSTVVDNLLEKSVDKKYYLSERIKPTILSNGTKTFKSKSDINQLIARPLTATMVKMHRACQDNYYSNGFLNSKNPIKYAEKEFSKESLLNHKIRKITPLEALKLQGFDKYFHENSKTAQISDHQIYKQSGNAVSVNVVYAILAYLYDKKVMI